jgi:hypothetical protein
VTLPPSDNGHYEIDVYTDGASAGCGRPGAEVVLWTYADDRKLYATAALPWPPAHHDADDPGGGDVVAFDVEFATTDPSGAAGAITELSGEVYDDDSTRRHEPGTRVEAYVGPTLCGEASVRDSGSRLTAASSIRRSGRSPASIASDRRQLWTVWGPSRRNRGNIKSPSPSMSPPCLPTASPGEGCGQQETSPDMTEQPVEGSK